MKLSHILLLGLALRVLWAVLVPVSPVSDSVVYDVLAQRISAGHGYSWPNGSPAIYWAVGTSAIYSAVYSAFGHSYAAVAVTNIVMGTLLILAVHALAKTRFDDRIARLAAFLVAVWPSWIAFSSVLSSELPSTLLVAAGMAVIMSRWQSFPLRTSLGSALLVAGAFVRPTILPLIVFVPVFDALLAGRWRSAVLAGLLAAIIGAAALTPWAMRNDAHFGKPVLVSANFGSNLWMGNNPDTTGGYMRTPDDLPKGRVMQDEILKQRALKFIAEDPIRYLQLCLRRSYLAFNRETIGVVWNKNGLPDFAEAPLKVLMSGYWLLVFGLSLFGALLYVWKAPIRMFDPLIVASALFGSVPILVVGMDRYHFGLAPFVAIFAAYSLVWLREARRPAVAAQPALQ